MAYLDRFKLEGKRVVITGAAHGIGYSIAEAMLEAGAQVVLTDIDSDALANADRRACRKDYLRA
ncbi:SDR family NAD(P)-dependent oxidoreductase [Lentilitoribacter sp. Alg239-R112]|uniref:SDR family NAD(P)-dependent oxidoreductase n=1 Tax=Lentilitoribacter sp. Alg239-R112 TaxID=2305987 RepID=UPI0013A6FFA0|nr:SDR family NAD(P)-dependent oxidoreductase [Lentilitoribacter sp. Alg239-R112]